MREDSRRAAAEAVEPLLKFLEGLERGVALILRTQDRVDRQVMLGSLRKDLQTAEAVLTTLKTRIASAGTRLEQLKEKAKEIRARVGPPIEADVEPRAERRIERARGGGRPAKPPARSRRPWRPAGTRKKNMPGAPANLLPEAEALWRDGLKTHIANKLARAGFTSWEQILETPLAELVSTRGLGVAVRHEVLRALRAKGIEPARSRHDEAALPVGPRKPATGRSPVRRRKRLPQAPQHLLPAAEALWREGLQVGIANRLARLGLTSWQQVLATDLGSVKGIGVAVRYEVERLKQDKLQREKKKER